MSNNSDWYARKMGQQKPSSTVPQTTPLQPMRYVPQQQSPNIPVQYDPEADQLVTKAQSARQSELCPGCMSGNYFAPLGTQRKRCYDCGYPIMQQGSGLAGSGTGNGPVQAAKQVGQTDGFNPGTIVDRIG
jgi:hypothetical protein